MSPARPVKKRKPKDKKRNTSPSSQWLWVWVAGILIATLLSYWPGFQNGFAWDDIAYVQKNPLIFKIDIPLIFSSYLAGNYHPLTVLVHAIEFYFFSFDPAGYHAVNIFIHLLNTLMVFIWIRAFSEKNEIALVAALLFGVHPLHVESVAWISELKDVLYTAFFLAALILYERFSKTRKWSAYAFTILLFLLSLLSKGMAVCFPVVLVLVDIVKGRWHSRKSWLEKIPFFILSVIFGLVAIQAQESEAALHEDVIPLMQRIIFAAYGYITYLHKLIFPLPLSAYYPYPVAPHESIPPIYFAYLLPVLGILFLCWRSWKTNKVIFFGIGFFTITILLVLKILPVGYAVMADRYTYLASIGIFYLAGEGFLWLTQKSGLKLGHKSGLALLVGFTAFFTYLTHERCKVWKDNLALWNSVIRYDEKIAIAFLNRGVHYIDNQQYDLAEPDLDEAIRLNASYADAYFNRGIVYQNTARVQEAIDDYGQALRYNESHSKALINRANLYRDNGFREEALADYNLGLAIKPDIQEGYNNRAILYLNEEKFGEAIQDLNMAISLNPKYINAYINRGNAYMRQGNYDYALEDYNMAISLHPQSGLAYFNRGHVYRNTNQFQQACENFSLAAQFGYGPANDALAIYCQ